MAKSITVNKNGFTPIANGENKVHTIYSCFGSVFVKIGKQSTSFGFIKVYFLNMETEKSNGIVVVILSKASFREKFDRFAMVPFNPLSY